MFDLYTSIVFITFFVLIITAVGVIKNYLVSKKNKNEIITICLLIGIASICEWIGVKTNGASVSLIWLHRSAKFVEFCVAPTIAVVAAIAYGKAKHFNVVAAVLIFHTAFEIVSLKNNWIFSVDADNIYHREGLYWIYIVVFAMSVVYCFIAIVQGGKRYQARFGSVLFLILCFLAAGVGIQMLHSEIRIDFMCVAIGNVLLYNYWGNIVNQVDTVTQLLNRRCYERHIENMQSPAYVLVFDANKFKLINDTYGHAEGDKSLNLIAQQIKAVYGKYGFCYRIGGDEFCVIMYKCLDKLKVLNRQFTEAVEQLRENNAKIFGVAFGYAYYDENKIHIIDAIKEADEMMYNNKH